MDNSCPICQTPSAGKTCLNCDTAMEATTELNQDCKVTTKTAYLVDLVSNHKIKIPSPACKIGRDESNDIVISGDQAISRHHLVISTEGEQFLVEDFNSRHGTFLNGNQVKTREYVHDGDVIKIGVSLFWFVVEADVPSEQASALELPRSGSDPGLPVATDNSGSQSSTKHVAVKSEFFLEQSDPSASTASEIPVITNEDSLLERIRAKARSFDHSGLLSKNHSQPGSLKPILNGSPAAQLTQTQQELPAMDPLFLDPKSQAAKPGPSPYEPESPSVTLPAITKNSAKTLKTSDDATSTTKDHNDQREWVEPKNADSGQALPVQTDPLINACLTELEKKYDRLEEEILQAEKSRQEIAEQIELIKQLVSSLTGGTDSKLVDACSRVLASLGWQCSLSEQDNHELQLKSGDQCSLARIIWTTDIADRSHLGQLFISQTRYWCEKGLEPKGILIVSCQANSDDSGKDYAGTGNQDNNSELATYAISKNVCLMSTGQILAIYRDVTLKGTDAESLREKIVSTNGWLEYNN